MRTSSHSFSGSDLWVMAPPAPSVRSGEVLEGQSRCAIGDSSSCLLTLASLDERPDHDGPVGGAVDGEVTENTWRHHLAPSLSSKMGKPARKGLTGISASAMMPLELVEELQTTKLRCAGH